MAVAQVISNGSKCMRKAVFSDVDDFLLMWLKDAYNKGGPLSDPLLKEKANKSVQDMNLQFTCTDGWLS